MIIRFRQHQRQARHPHYRDHSRVEAAVRNRRTSPAPYIFPGRHLNHRRKHANPEVASDLFQEAGSRIGIIGASTHSLKRSALTSDEQRGYPIADYSRNQRPPQRQSNCRNT
jgi:hypothetical protein